jgi:hypothetical protein
MDHLVLNNNNHSLTQTYFKTRSMAMSYTFCLGEIQYTPSTKRFLYCLISFRSVFFHSTTMQLLEQELPTLPEHMSSPSVFNGGWLVGWDGRSLVLCVCFVDRCLSFFRWPLCCLSFFDLRYLQTLLQIYVVRCMFIFFTFFKFY